MKEKLIKSKDRVKNFAEVFTPSWVVNDMCDQIPKEIWENLDSTFLEPTCGNGNFLVEILRRKLALCKNENDVLRAYRSIYGIDIQADNVLETRVRMLKMAKGYIKNPCNLIEISDILSKNIICGNSLYILKQQCE